MYQGLDNSLMAMRTVKHLSQGMVCSDLLLRWIRSGQAPNVDKDVWRLMFNRKFQLALHDLIQTPLPTPPHSPLLSHLVSLWKKERCQKPICAFLETIAASSLAAASCQSPCLSAQLLTVLEHNTSLLLAYNLYSLAALVPRCGFSSLHLWIWRIHRRAALLNIPVVPVGMQTRSWHGGPVCAGSLTISGDEDDGCISNKLHIRCHEILSLLILQVERQ